MASMTPRVRLVVLAWVWLVAAAVLLCAQSVVGQADTPAASPESPSTPTLEPEKDHHVLRTALIFYMVMLGVWLILSMLFTYIFIRVCPNRYTK
ncbi:hypothetical protein NESM_000749900 [Novymonas esmeraldas]|uniref:Envelope glycoprotein N n=1 Tax=Novymonas esmeraldas TaxID=1808958 RepID=A0AAW0EY01_9TRYP